jgi:hypothetical protein
MTKQEVFEKLVAIYVKQCDRTLSDADFDALEVEYCELLLGSDFVDSQIVDYVQSL